MKRRLEKILLTSHYGFCMGVKRAIKIAEETGGSANGPVNVINEIVHNDSVVRNMALRGVGAVSSVNDAPEGTVIISAHGAPPQVFEEARARELNIIDATCPLVIRIHKIIHKLIENNYHIIHFGDHHHDETIGVVGQAPPGSVNVVNSLEGLRALPVNGCKYALTTQTTAGVNEFERISEEAAERFPNIEIFNTICNATTRLQEAVLDLAPEVDLMLVVGSSSSANSNRLRNISEAICGRAYLINSAEFLDVSWLNDIAVVGLTAGASTPDFLVEEVVEKLLEFSGNSATIIRSPKDKKKLAEETDDQ